MTIEKKNEIIIYKKSKQQIIIGSAYYVNKMIIF